MQLFPRESFASAITSIPLSLKYKPPPSILPRIHFRLLHAGSDELLAMAELSEFVPEDLGREERALVERGDLSEISVIVHYVSNSLASFVSYICDLTGRKRNWIAELNKSYIRAEF